MTASDYRKLNRRQFVKQASFTGIGLAAIENRFHPNKKGNAYETIAEDQSLSRQRRIIVSEDGPWWLTGDGRLTRRHLERFVEELAGPVDAVAMVMAMPDICFYPTKAGELWRSA